MELVTPNLEPGEAMGKPGIRACLPLAKRSTAATGSALCTVAATAAPPAALIPPAASPAAAAEPFSGRSVSSRRLPFSSLGTAAT